MTIFFVDLLNYTGCVKLDGARKRGTKHAATKLTCRASTCAADALPGSFPSGPKATTEIFHVLEGVFFLTNADGSARRCGPGDMVVLPKGWVGHWDIIETVKKVWVDISD